MISPCQRKSISERRSGVGQCRRGRTMSPDSMCPDVAWATCPWSFTGETPVPWSRSRTCGRGVAAFPRYPIAAVGIDKSPGNVCLWGPARIRRGVGENSRMTRVGLFGVLKQSLSHKAGASSRTPRRPRFLKCIGSGPGAGAGSRCGAYRGLPPTRDHTWGNAPVVWRRGVLYNETKGWSGRRCLTEYLTKKDDPFRKIQMGGILFAMDPVSLGRGSRARWMPFQKPTGG